MNAKMFVMPATGKLTSAGKTAILQQIQANKARAVELRRKAWKLDSAGLKLNKRQYRDEAKHLRANAEQLEMANREFQSYL